MYVHNMYVNGRGRNVHLCVTVVPLCVPVCVMYVACVSASTVETGMCTFE